MMAPDDVNPRNWAAIVGKWSIDGGDVTYDGPQDVRAPFGVCLTDLDVTDGTISARVQLTGNSEGRILLAYRAVSEPYIMVGLRGWGRAYTVGEYDPAIGWQMLDGAGTADNLATDRWYEVSAAITGQRIRLTVDGVRVLDHRLGKPLSGGQLGLFAWGQEPVRFMDFRVELRPGTVFVVMQFSEPYKQLYEQVIEPVSASFGLLAYHIGDVSGPGVILHDIAQGIVGATIVVAEITPSNQNVFYELGYAHARGKPTILLAERGKQLPFDISGYRVLFYENTIAGKKQVEDGFKKHLEAILKE
jgi:hypothetical protein